MAFSNHGWAQEALGPTYTIVEPDMLKAIDTHLRQKEKSGDFEKMEKEAVARAKSNIENPPGVKGLLRVEKENTFYFDPSFRVDKTVKDHTGQVIAEAGTTVNPLDYATLSKHLFFFDGADPYQVKKAEQLIKHYNGLVKPIMTNGPLGQITRKWKSQVFFDQGGALVRKLGIRRVPSLVSQEGKKIRIDELLVERK